MGHGHRRDDRVRGASPGHLHGNRRLPPCVRGLCREAQACVRGELSMTMTSTLHGPTREHLDWPFFGGEHRDYVEQLDAFAASGAMAAIDHADVDGACRELVAALGNACLLDACVAAADGDASTIDSRKACLARETLAFHDGLADFAFAVQGLGSGAIGAAGSPELRRAFLPKIRSGEWLAAFALSEKEAGSDVASMTSTARADGNDYIIDGEKTWISNGGIAD